MADCGATGMALDRAAARFLMNGSSSSGKEALSSLIGHAANNSSQQSSYSSLPAVEQLPALRPANYLSAAESQARTTTDAAAVSTTTTSVRIHAAGPWHHQSHPSMRTVDHHHHHQQQQQQQQQHPLTVQYHSPQHQHGLITMQQHPQYTPQETMTMMIQQQQQQNSMLLQMVETQKYQQQQQQLLRQQQQQQQNLQHEENPIGHEGIVKPVSIEELATAWAQAGVTEDGDNITVGHEGRVTGASMDELAAAWAQAEQEYQNELSAWDHDDEVTGNLWTQGGDDDKERYEFINKDAVPTEAERQQGNWMEEGMRQFEAGNLDAAIRAFELELQHHNMDNAAAWHMLGRCHAENDMDRDAIQCLEQAVDRDPYCAEALLALGVCYVNELNHVQALRNLKAWITHNPKFAGLDETSAVEDLYGAATSESLAPSSAEQAFDEVQRLLLQALEFHSQHQPNTEDHYKTQADILEALGVVYNVSGDYEAAIDALQKACRLRPNDYQLWNKLGATLANSSRCDEALPMYRTAIELKPKYARAWLNMAISHSNLSHYDEAARCYLQTLSLNPAAVHCWSYLRIAVSCMEQWDLMPLVAARNLPALREHFDFVLYDADYNNNNNE